MEAKRLLVLSDTHGNVSALKSVLRWAASRQAGGVIEAAVFLGDGLHDLSVAQAEAVFSGEWKKVRGNNDSFYPAPEADVFDFGGNRFFLCHGHRYSLYNGFDRLIAAAVSNGANAVLFGHLHVPVLEYAQIPHSTSDKRIFLINPGSISQARSRAGSTFAVIECQPEPPAECAARASPPVQGLAVKFWGIDRAGNINEI